jgi:glycolate oxidase
MYRIIEIDEKNMFAVIEPYVIGATLQAEAMKVGLNTHMIGAGASCSPLASASSLRGPGPDSIFMGSSPENLLAAEWVMPSGDILRTGSLGSGTGWFSGDGLGPSVRGIFKGSYGAAGGLGVFTKVAVKLYPWPGPAVMPVEGKVPAYTTRLPDNIRTHTLAWSTWAGCADALYKVFNNDIGYIVHRQFIMFGDELQAAIIKILTDTTRKMNDLEELQKKPKIRELSEEMRRAFQIVLAGMTPRDIEYQERVLDRILAETGGWKVAAMEEPAIAGWSALYLIKLCFKNLNYIYAGSYFDAMTGEGTPDLMASGWMETVREQKRKFGKQGGIVDDGGDAGMGGMGGMGGGGYYNFENFSHYDPSDAESVEAVWACCVDAGRIAAEESRRLGGGGDIASAALYLIPKETQKTALAGVTHPAVFKYQRKIKEALDPNGVGDGSYLYLDENEIEAGSKKAGTALFGA